MRHEIKRDFLACLLAGLSVILGMASGNANAQSDYPNKPIRVLLPRVLVDVEQVDTGTTILGQAAQMPLVVAPMGAVGFGRRGGDLAIARAARAAGVPYVLSTMATASIERIAREAGGRLWFQAYVFKERAQTARLIARAEAAGYEALMITVDIPVGGKRERDLRNDFAIPFRFTPKNLLDFASRPAWALDMLVHGVPVVENLLEFAPDTKDTAQLASSVGRSFSASFDWAGLAEIRAAWPRKLVLKGVLRADDAERAAALGCDALVVSNHGGRQLDGGSASVAALPAVVAAVGGRCPVLVDGGVRRGVDILKARALGAEAVLIGRPALYGVCAAGEAGARHALEILHDELVRGMRLCGVTAVAAISRDLLAHAA